MTRRGDARPRPSGEDPGTTPLFRPLLGDLVLDTGKGGRVGVVIALPGDGRKTYQLCSSDGAEKWSAAQDGASLQPVPPEAVDIGLRPCDTPLVCRVCRRGSSVRLVAAVPTTGGPDRPVYACAAHADELRRTLAQSLTRGGDSP
ncbi:MULTISPECIES: hypothetical protein [Streptomyces]|uniref:Uncharacterized protein n=1 Tax=Streptomyces tsukubensis (strain DSM 42081 / NBRC 108919 / NRRL 18488 / 9993) TaxID=1114943 RepID=I2MYZ2_STRT9|nr:MULTISPECIES: hypothetical protein [Streptomyces]AZK94276.1 hypothetical protein B7R87_10675 [Streptomyces tsukubensis]EIF89989.1 hypothetical protein [Streptomyces tsukubensis NRRL18488]MYS66347.1 hypothetical protein [Streptomyces sp. SID5473]QKM69628.1 hypothetical protein STSU_023120 [Streptomyces tsukubensis NRRL18488]TAI46410.1 hypothetical protein EWI31_05035 [Streptomyces tsukubensis]